MTPSAPTPKPADEPAGGPHAQGLETPETSETSTFHARGRPRTRLDGLQGVSAAIVVAVVSTWLLLLVLPGPRRLTADEVDTLRGGRQLVDLLTCPEHDPRLQWGGGLRGRLRAGFVPTDNPRLAALPDSAPRRAVIESPVPRWLAALGIGVLPVSEDATNLERARVGAALALGVSLGLLVFAYRRRGLRWTAFVVAAAFGLPGFLDAGASAGYGAASVLSATLFLLAMERLLATGRGATWVMAALGLGLGVHPLMVALTVTVFLAWSIGRPAADQAASRTADGHVRLPAAPLGLFLVPLGALVALVVLWPALWNDTGKRLGAWLIDFGSMKSPPAEVLGVLYDQGAARAAQAFTATLQWLAHVPLPLVVLWGLGLARAVRLGARGAWLPILFVATLLVAAGLDGGLFGARLSLLEVLWIPTLLTAADGFEALTSWITDRASRRARWPRWLGATSLGWIVGGLLLLPPILQSARGTTLGLAERTGLEARFALPMELTRVGEAVAPGATMVIRPAPTAFAPALDALRTDLESSLSSGPEGEAELLLSFGEPPPDLVSRLRGPLVLPNTPRGPGLWRLAPVAAP